MSPDREVELKFLCTPADLGAVLAAAPAGDDESRELISVYFDTADLTLQKAGVTLRVRESKGRRIQTLKRGEGLSREEHEAPISGDRPDRELGPLKTYLPDDEALHPAFNVRVTRRQRTLRYQDAEIELALDQGEVTGGSRRSPICEVELELKSGPPAALFTLARELSRSAALYISFDGKAARGQALVADAPLQARRAEQAAIGKHATAIEAFQAVARNALGQIAANALVLRVEAGPEAVHQIRVAARRLRSALSTFKGVAAGPGLDAVKADLKWLATEFNDARNLDVLTDSVAAQAKALTPPPPGLDALSAALDTARRHAWARAAETAASGRFRALMIDATAWMETGAWLDAAPAISARAFADKALRKRLHRVVKRGKGLRHADDEARHHLRIEGKKLRYAAEAFACLYAAGPMAKFIGRVKALQDVLGELNDVAVSGPLLAALPLGPRAALVAGELIGLRLAGKDRLIADAGRAFDRLADGRAPFA